jgi:CarD family transcriptional regulator
MQEGCVTIGAPKPLTERWLGSQMLGGMLMFQVGDKVVYPAHGAGVIESIEEQEVLGKTKCYYVMRLPINDMKVMVPTENMDEVGLRQVLSEEALQTVLDVLQSRKTMMSKNWNHRYRSNLEKIRSGNILELAEVVRNLYHREKEKGLSNGERKMLDNARQILLSEIVLAKDLAVDQANSFLDQVLAQ